MLTSNLKPTQLDYLRSQLPVRKAAANLLGTPIDSTQLAQLEYELGLSSQPAPRNRNRNSWHTSGCKHGKCHVIKPTVSSSR